MENSEEVGELEKALAGVGNGEALSREEVDHYLNRLESFECWNAFLKLMEGWLASESKPLASDYARLAYVYFFHLEEYKKGAQTCARGVEALVLNYHEFRQMILEKVLAGEDYGIESEILQHVYEALPPGEDQISCLERLCLIYEKKRFDEGRLRETCDRLLQVDPCNQRALRYFKAMHIQSGEWSEAVSILEKMYESALHVNDQYRMAQEMATIHLYQLNDPQKAIDILKNRCNNSPLDISNVMYEAYYQIEDWEQCLEVLKDCKKEPLSDRENAIICYRMAELEVALGQLDRGESHLEESLRLNPNLLESYEVLIDLAISKKRWPKVVASLEKLKSVVIDQDLADRLAEVIGRLNHGLAHEK